MSRLFVGALITPHGGSVNGAVAFDPEKEMVIYQRSDGVYSVQDPLFPERYNIGDKSFFNGVVDEYLRATIDYYGIHLSTRHLINVEEREKKLGTGRWSTLQHSIGAAAVTQLLGGMPQQVMYAATHDVGKRSGGHRTDDLLDGRGPENAHDKDRRSFIERSGFLGFLQSRGIITADGTVEELGIHISDIIDPPDIPSLINMPSKTGDLEPERIQYALYEYNIWIRTNPAFVQEILQSFEVREYQKGNPIIIARNQNAAHTLWTAFLRCHTEHWGEPVDSILNELVNVQKRFMLLHPDGATKDLREYSAGDTLYISEEDLIKRSRSFETAHGRAFMGGLDKIVTAIASHQREVHLQYSDGSIVYGRPMTPDWIKLIFVNEHSTDSNQHTRFQDNDESLVVQVHPGKQRFVNPVVHEGGMQRPQRLEDMSSQLTEIRALRQRWASLPFTAHVDLHDRRLNLTQEEIRAMQAGLGMIATEWSRVGRRPAMPDERLAKRIREFGIRTRERSVSAARSDAAAKHLNPIA